jgi:hypothetical protein
MTILPAGPNPNSLEAWATLDKDKYARESFLLLKKYGPGSQNDILKALMQAPDDPELPNSLHFHSMPPEVRAKNSQNIYARLHRCKKLGLAIITGQKKDENTSKTVDIYAPNPNPPVELPRILSLRMILDNIDQLERQLQDLGDTSLTCAEMISLVRRLRVPPTKVRRGGHRREPQTPPTTSTP